MADLVETLQELQALGVSFISLGEALDFTTPTGLLHPLRAVRAPVLVSRLASHGYDPRAL